MWEDLPEVRNGNYLQLMNDFVRQVAPYRHHKVAKSKIWRYPRPDPDKGICFSTRTTLMSGPTDRVIEVGRRAAIEAALMGDQTFVDAAADAIAAIPDEISRRIRQSEQERKMRQLIK